MWQQVNLVGRGRCNKPLSHAESSCFCFFGGDDSGLLFCTAHALKMNVDILGPCGKCESLSKSKSGIRLCDSDDWCLSFPLCGLCNLKVDGFAQMKHSTKSSE